MSERRGLIGHLHRLVRQAERPVERRWRPLSRRLGRERPRSLIPYCGWNGAGGVRCGARVLANPPTAELRDDAGWWRNLRDTYRRWETDEIPGVGVRGRLGGESQEAVSDEEGYLHFDLPAAAAASGGYWQSARLELVSVPHGPLPALAADCPIINPGPHAAFGIISDLDDTVIQTGIANLFTAARLTFLHNARTRKPFEGVAALYQALHTGSVDPLAPPRNPIFYVSSSGWNLYDLLWEFIAYNDIPRGPILLQDLGVDAEKFIAGGHRHKLDKARRLLDEFPRLPFLLFGDSGQQDAGLYAELAEERPDRVKAIFIRDVAPPTARRRDAEIHRQIARAHAVGVPMWLVTDSAAAARHLIDLRFLPAEALAGIERDRRQDKARRLEA